MPNTNKPNLHPSRGMSRGVVDIRSNEEILDEAATCFARLFFEQYRWAKRQEREAAQEEAGNVA